MWLNKNMCLQPLRCSLPLVPFRSVTVSCTTGSKLWLSAWLNTAQANVPNQTTKSLFGLCPRRRHRIFRPVTSVYLVCQLFLRGAGTRARGSLINFSVSFYATCQTLKHPLCLCMLTVKTEGMFAELLWFWISNSNTSELSLFHLLISVWGLLLLVEMTDVINNTLDQMELIGDNVCLLSYYALCCCCCLYSRFIVSEERPTVFSQDFSALIEIN